MNRIKLLLMVAISFICILFVYNDHFLYKDTIIKVNKVKNKLISTDDSGEKHYDQTLTGTIKNGKNKGKKISFESSKSSSGVMDEQLNKNSEVFVEISDRGNEVATIIGLKRDKYIVLLLVLFIDSILLVAKKKGFQTLISLTGNILMTFVILFIKIKHHTFNLLLLFSVVSIFFIVFSMLVTNGKNRKSLAAIISSLISLFISFGISLIVINVCGKNVPFWTIEYIDAIIDYKNYFYVIILLSGLGAIMDISITLASSLNELIEKNNKISTKQLKKSGWEISKDIVGTMTNVMLFTCYTSIIPTAEKTKKNGLSIYETFYYYGQIELIVVLTSCISIVLAIPISLYVSVYILKKKKVLV